MKTWCVAKIRRGVFCLACLAVVLIVGAVVGAFFRPMAERVVSGQLAVGDIGTIICRTGITDGPEVMVVEVGDGKIVTLTGEDVPRPGDYSMVAKTVDGIMPLLDELAYASIRVPAFEK